MIDIYFRTSSNKKATARPPWFSYEKCWNNLIQTRMNNPITVIHDGPVDESSKYEKYENVKVIEIDSEKI